MREKFRRKIYEGKKFEGKFTREKISKENLQGKSFEGKYLKVTILKKNVRGKRYRVKVYDVWSQLQARAHIYAIKS